MGRLIRVALGVLVPTFMAPARGLLTPRALKVEKYKNGKSLVTKYVFLLRICMCKAVTISYGSRAPPSPLDL